jgi:tetratricopeptide (TPR) repeat protein
MLSLFSTSLINKDPENGTIHVHRLVQAEFRENLSPNDQYQSFMLTIKLLLEAFPKHGKGRSLRNEFATCKKFIIHVMALLDRLKEFKFVSQAPGDFNAFCELAANCAWYLMEIGSWDEFFTLTNIALDFCEDKESLLYADLCNTVGQVECERGRAHAARPYLVKSRSIREKKLPKDSEELSDLYNNYANMVNVEWKDDAALDEALKLYERALTIDETKPLAERSKVLHTRHLNFGTLYTCQGRYTEALEQLKLGHKYCLETFGAGTHWDAT